MLNNYYSRKRLSNYNSTQILTIIDSKGELYEGNFAFYEIWSRLDGKHSVEEIIKDIQVEYDATEIIGFENDIISIIKEMLEYELIDEDNTIVPQINYIENHILATHIAITSYCNLHCSHCYLDEKNCGLIALKDFENLLKDLADIGVLTIEISGGEPLTHDEFFTFIRLAKEYGFYLKLFTNATLINTNNVECIKKYIDCYRVSLDGNLMTHDLRRGNGSFAKTFAALRLLEGCNVQLTMTVDDVNCNDIIAVRHMASDLNFKFEASPVVPYTHIKFTYDKLNLIRGKINETILSDNAQNKRANIKGVNCEAAIRSLYVSSNLDLTPCPLLYQSKWHIGNLKNLSIKTLLISDKYINILKYLDELKSNCRGCNKCQFWCAAIVDQTLEKVSPFCVKRKL